MAEAGRALGDEVPGGVGSSTLSKTRTGDRMASRISPAERFGDNLKTARGKTDLSQAALARAAGFSSSEVSRLEAGIREPRLTTILRLADALAIDVTVLLNGIDRSPDY
jgi:predicted transcriptional regulator